MRKDNATMAVTDEELQEQRERVESLRLEVAEVNAQREQAEREQSNQVTYDQLKVEEARLAAALEAAKNAGVNTANRESDEDEPVAATKGNPTPDPAPAAPVVAASPTARTAAAPEPPAGGPVADQNKEN